MAHQHTSSWDFSFRTHTHGALTATLAAQVEGSGRKNGVRRPQGGFPRIEGANSAPCCTAIARLVAIMDCSRRQGVHNNYQVLAGGRPAAGPPVAPVSAAADVSGGPEPPVAPATAAVPVSAAVPVNAPASVPAPRRPTAALSIPQDARAAGPPVDTHPMEFFTTIRDAGNPNDTIVQCPSCKNNMRAVKGNLIQHLRSATCSL